MPPPETGSLIFLVTGTDSPVNEDSSIWEVPSTTTPSVATLSPVRTEIKEPTGTRSAGTTTISFVSGWTRLACSGLSWTIAAKAVLALSVALVSRYSDTLNKKATLAASSNSPNNNAPIAAVTIIQLASNSHRRIVLHALIATGGSPKKTDSHPAYCKTPKDSSTDPINAITQKMPDNIT